MSKEWWQTCPQVNHLKLEWATACWITSRIRCIRRNNFLVLQKLKFIGDWGSKREIGCGKKSRRQLIGCRYWNFIQMIFKDRPPETLYNTNGENGDIAAGSNDKGNWCDTITCMGLQHASTGDAPELLWRSAPCGDNPEFFKVIFGTIWWQICTGLSDFGWNVIVLVSVPALCNGGGVENISCVLCVGALVVLVVFGTTWWYSCI